MTRGAANQTEPQTDAPERKPKFGDVVINGWASDDNPQKQGYFVRKIKRTGKLNPGTFWELTDRDGKFWSASANKGHKLSVIPMHSALKKAQAENAALRAQLAAAREVVGLKWIKERVDMLSARPMGGLLRYTIRPPFTDTHGASRGFRLYLNGELLHEAQSTVPLKKLAQADYERRIRAALVEGGE